MRKVLLLAVLALAVAAASAPATAVVGETEVYYEQLTPGAPIGELTLLNAQGRHFAAFDQHGALVLEGVPHKPEYHVLCPNSGPDCDGLLLTVHVEPDQWFSIFEPKDPWHWDR